MEASEQSVESPEVKPAKAKPAKKPAKKAAPKAAKKAAPKKPGKKVAPAAKAKADKPKAEKKTPAVKDQWGLRKGSAKAEAAAMYARKSGATLLEVKDKVGSIQLNVLKQLEADGHTVKQERQERKGQRPVTRYWLTAK